MTMAAWALAGVTRMRNARAATHFGIGTPHNTFAKTTDFLAPEKPGWKPRGQAFLAKRPAGTVAEG
jgi:hypothetical protein